MICKNCKHLVVAEGEKFNAFSTYQCAAQLPDDLPIPGHMWRLLHEIQVERARPAFAWFSPSGVTKCRVHTPKETA